MIFPIHCSLCSTRLPTTQYLCHSCIECLPRQCNPAFFKEGIPCFAPFLYEGAVKWMLKQLKFSKHLLYANVLGQLMTESLQAYYNTSSTLIVPIPLHKKRLQERGFNQSLEVAKQISRHIHIPINHQSVTRHKATKSQAQCNAHERTQNIKQAFTLKKPLRTDHMILLDDVITTGSTILECYHMIKNAEITHIDLWAIARAL